MFIADCKIIFPLLRTLSIHFCVRLLDNRGWKWSLTEISAGDAISVGHCGIFAELPLKQLCASGSKTKK